MNHSSAKPLLIGLAGPMGSGKSTVASHLVREHHFAEYSFAAPLKEMVCTLFGVTELKLEEMKRSDLPILSARNGTAFPPMRRVLQTIGTEWGRHQIHPELWLAIAEQRLNAMTEWLHVERIVISDVRFENEADFIRRKGGVIVHIQPKERPQGGHASENALSVASTDCVLPNLGTLAQLYRTTNALLAVIKGEAAGSAA